MINIKIKNKKYLLTIFKVVAVGFMSLVLGIGFINITGAWFVTGEIISNTKNIGNVNIETTTINNPFIYDGTAVINVPFSINNLSNTHVVVRAYINVSWTNNDSVGAFDVVLANSNWTLGDDHYYYYNNVVNPQNQTGDQIDFLSSIELLNAINSQINNTFLVNVYVEAVQYANFGYQALWTSSPLSWSNNLS